eukprot:1159126-Pelagomonas_calceolata.AAC.6
MALSYSLFDTQVVQKSDLVPQQQQQQQEHIFKKQQPLMGSIEEVRGLRTGKERKSLHSCTCLQGQLSQSKQISLVPSSGAEWSWVPHVQKTAQHVPVLPPCTQQHARSSKNGVGAAADEGGLCAEASGGPEEGIWQEDGRNLSFLDSNVGSGRWPISAGWCKPCTVVIGDHM